MTSQPTMQPPPDADQRRAAKPVVVYALDELPAHDAAFYDNARVGLTKIGETVVPPREGRVRGPRRPFLSHRQHRWSPGRRPQSLECGRPRRAVLQRQDAGAARHPCQHRRPALEHAAPPEADGDDQLGHAGLVRLGRGRCRRARCHRHPVRSLHQPPVGRAGLPPLLPLEPDARAGGAEKLASREAEPHVHDVLNVFMCTGFHPRGAPLFHEGESRAPRRFHRVLRRDRPARRAVGLPRRRLWRDAFLRRSLLFSAQGRDFPPARRRAARLALPEASAYPGPWGEA